MSEKEGERAKQGPLRWILTPHRSLGRLGFIVLMAAVSLVSFAAGVFFWMLGAWPVPGFFGLDVLLLYTAFKLNDRSARAYEQIELDEGRLALVRVNAKGQATRRDINPYWARIELTEHFGRASELAVASHGERFVIGSCLSEPERREFGRVLHAALARLRFGSAAQSS